jgi:hypothetical protein
MEKRKRRQILDVVGNVLRLKWVRQPIVRLQEAV